MTYVFVFIVNTPFVLLYTYMDINVNIFMILRDYLKILYFKEGDSNSVILS